MNAIFLESSWQLLWQPIDIRRGDLILFLPSSLCLIGVVFAVLLSLWEVQHPWFVSIGCKGIPYMLHLLLLVHWILCDIVCPVDGCFHHWSLVFYVVEQLNRSVWVFFPIDCGFGGSIIIIHMYHDIQEQNHTICLLSSKLDVGVDTVKMLREGFNVIDV